MPFLFVFLTFSFFFFIVISKDPIKFVIPIKSEEYEPETQNGLACNLRFMYPPNYPDDHPEVEISENENLNDNDVDLLKEHIMEEVCYKYYGHYYNFYFIIRYMAK